MPRNMFIPCSSCPSPSLWHHMFHPMSYLLPFYVPILCLITCAISWSVPFNHSCQLALLLYPSWHGSIRYLVAKFKLAILLFCRRRLGWRKQCVMLSCHALKYMYYKTTYTVHSHNLQGHKLSILYYNMSSTHLLSSANTIGIGKWLVALRRNEPCHQGGGTYQCL